MRISRKCQYALRAVFELALRNNGQPVKISEIAGAQNIPPRFLEVILNQLRHAGFVKSRRGNEGGYMLARPAREITIGQIIQYAQGPISLSADNPVRPGKSQYFYGDYAFKELWQKLSKAVYKICDNTTFAELVESETARKTATVPNYAI